MEITEKRIKETKVAYAQFKGSYDKISEHMQEVGQLVIDETAFPRPAGAIAATTPAMAVNAKTC